MNVICVTGPMAAGKNAASSILEKLGFACVDADVLGHKAIDLCEKEIIAAFEKEAKAASCLIVKEDGRLDRRALGALIFPRPDLLKRQEDIVYPAIEKLAADFMKEKEGQKIVLNATVLYKVPGLMNKCEKIIYVDAPKIQRFFRARRRDGMKGKQITGRFKAQKNLFKEYEKTGIPVVRIMNTGSIESLEKKLKKYVETGF